MANAKLTTEDLDLMTSNPDWWGFGYVGSRKNFQEELLTGGHSAPDAKLLAKADAMVLTAANRHGYTEEQLFDWANSKKGRWYGDCWFGNNGKYANWYAPAPLNR